MADQITTPLAALKKSKFRFRFKLTEKGREYIHSKDIETSLSRAIDFITTRLATAFPKNDRKQKPMRGHPLFI